MLMEMIQWRGKTRDKENRNFRSKSRQEATGYMHILTSSGLCTSQCTWMTHEALTFLLDFSISSSHLPYFYFLHTLLEQLSDTRNNSMLG